MNWPRHLLIVAAVWTACAALVPVALAEKGARPPGFVDGAQFIDLFGDDAVSLEISLHGALLRAITSADEELHRLAGGLESIQAVVLELKSGDSGARARDLVRRTERGLLDRGWDRLARIKEQSSEVKVLVLNDDEAVHGLVVMVLDVDEGQVVFANVAGRLDLAAIKTIGQGLDFPGLKDIDLP